MTALIATDVLLDYLFGDVRAARVFIEYPHRSISVLTWLELMALAPDSHRDATRAFLRSFERLSIGEPTADEAQRLMREHAKLSFHQALHWSTAQLNKLLFVTADANGLPHDDASIVIPYPMSPQSRSLRASMARTRGAGKLRAQDSNR